MTISTDHLVVLVMMMIHFHSCNHQHTRLVQWHYPLFSYLSHSTLFCLNIFTECVSVFIYHFSIKNVVFVFIIIVFEIVVYVRCVICRLFSFSTFMVYLRIPILFKIIVVIITVIDIKRSCEK